MKNILILTKLNVKRYYFAVLLSILGAVMLCLLLYAMGNIVANSTIAKVHVGILDYDQSTLSKDFKRYLKEEMDYELLENYSYQELSTELLDKDISVIIEIPENFMTKMMSGGAPKVIITSMDDYENTAFVEAHINSYLSSIQVLASGAGGDKQIFDQLLMASLKEEITLTKTSAANIDKNKLFGESGFINTVGFFLMFIFTISVILGFMIIEDRVKGVFGRIQATPVKPIQYIIGSGLFGLVLSSIMVVLFTLFIYINKIQIGVPLETVFLLMLLFSLFTVCFSLMIALATKSRNSVTAIVIGFSTIGCILGGAYFPLDMAPDTLQKIARILPQFWFMDAFRRLQLDLHANIYPNIIILALFVALSFLIGAVLFAQNYKNS